MDNIVGNPVRGENLLFRNRDVQEIITRLNGGSVLLIGLRRIGKSSVMWGVHDRLPSHWIKSFHDLQGMRDPADFFLVLLKSLPESSHAKLVKFWSGKQQIPTRLVKSLKKHIRSIAGVELNDDIVNYWEPLCQGIEAVIRDNAAPLLIILDELPYLLESMLQAGHAPHLVEKMLGQLRQWRNRYPQFRMLVGGSISLDHLLSRNGISASTISDFSRHSLQPLQREEARCFLRELADSIPLAWFDAGMVEKSLGLLGDFFPFFLQTFMAKVRFHGGPGGKSLEVIYENHFLPEIDKNFFRTFLDRLEHHYQDRQRATARNILRCIALDGDFTANYSRIRETVCGGDGTEAHALDESLYHLVADEFLVFDSITNEYRFTCRNLGKWWRVTWGR